MQEVILFLQFKLCMRYGLLENTINGLIWDGTAETRSVNLIELLLKLSVSLPLVFYLLYEVICVYILLLRLYLNFTQLLVQFPVDLRYFFDFLIASLNHFCELCLTYFHFSKDLAFTSYFSFCFSFVNSKTAIKLVLNFILLSFKLLAHLILKFLLGLLDPVIGQLLLSTIYCSWLCSLNGWSLLGEVPSGILTLVWGEIGRILPFHILFIVWLGCRCFGSSYGPCLGLKWLTHLLLWFMSMRLLHNWLLLFTNFAECLPLLLWLFTWALTGWLRCSDSCNIPALLRFVSLGRRWSLFYWCGEHSSPRCWSTFRARLFFLLFLIGWNYCLVWT